MTTNRVTIRSYDQKVCPVCGANHLHWERLSSGHIDAYYDCECQYIRGGSFGALWSYHEDVRRAHDSFLATVPAGYRRCLYDPIEATADNLDAVEILEDFGRGRVAFLHGPAGIGKTHLAIQTAMASVNQRLSVGFVSEIDLVNQFRAQALTGGDVALPALIVLDDVAKEGKPGEFYAKTFYRILEACVSSGRGLIVTSNHPPEEVAKRVAMDEVNRAAIISRLCAGDVIAMTGEDRRVGSLGRGAL